MLLICFEILYKIDQGETGCVTLMYTFRFRLQYMMDKRLLICAGLLISIFLCIKPLWCEEDYLSGPDKSDWVDPHDMLNYDPKTKTMKNRPQVGSTYNVSDPGSANNLQCILVL